jgi:hypothetical protein
MDGELGQARSRVREERRHGAGTVTAVPGTLVQSTPESRVQIVVLTIAVAVAAAVVALLLTRRDEAQPVVAPTGPVVVSQADLQRVARATGHPVYWGGPRSGFSYELTVTSEGRIFIRYLSDGVAAGDPRASFLAIGTYPGARSFADLARAAKRKDTFSMRLDRGGLGVISRQAPTSAYFAYPNADYQVEVFAPSRDTARRLVSSGAIRPIR